MRGNEPALTFGPVPSRRLGRSLGINNIPPKTCSYSCIYCQLGRTDTFASERRQFYQPGQIFDAVKQRVRECEDTGEVIDYLTFVPDGEPTLDSNLGRTLEALKVLDIPLAVITNSSLLWDKTVRDDLKTADFVSLKMDAASPEVWRRMNRPHGQLDFEQVLEGVKAFGAGFGGEFVTETMLVEGVNDSERELGATAEVIGHLQPAIAYIAVPTRPPAEGSARPPSPETLLLATEVFRRRTTRVEYLIGHEGNAFAASGDIERDLLSITAVHPMREDSVMELLRKNNADMAVVRSLVERGDLTETSYGGHTYFLRRFARGGIQTNDHIPKRCESSHWDSIDKAERESFQ